MTRLYSMIALVLFCTGFLWNPTSSADGDCSSCYQHLKVEIRLGDRKNRTLFVSIKPEMDNHESIWVNQDGSVGINPSLTEIRFYKELTTLADEKEYGSKGYCAKRKDILMIPVKKIKSIKLIAGMRETYGPVSVCN